MIKLLTTSALLTLAAALPSAASIVEVTFVGTVDQGYDVLDTFGTGNTDLTGQSVSVTFTYDTGLPLQSSTSTSTFLQGGTWYGVASPTSASYTIGATTLAVDGDLWSEVDLYDEPGGSSSFYSVADGYNDQVAVTCYGAPGEVPLDLATSYSVPSSACAGGATYVNFDDTGAPLGYSSFSFTVSTLSFVIDGVPQNPDPSPVPLPAGAALLATGLGGLAMLRRRRAKAA